MKKSLLYLISLFFLLCIMTSCSSKTVSFDDKKIDFKLVNHKLMDSEQSYTIEVKNNSSLELTHLILYLSYPIKQTNGTKSNPFSMEGRTNGGSPINLKKGETVKFNFYVPIKEVFGDTKRLDFNNPEIKLVGYFKKGSKEVPFGMSGDLKVYVGDFKANK